MRRAAIFAPLMLLFMAALVLPNFGDEGAKPAADEAKVRLQKGNVAEARAIYEKRLAANATIPAALLGLVRCDLAEGEYDAALKRIEAAIAGLEDAEKVPVAWQSQYAEMLYERGRWEDAEKQAEAVRKRDPENFQARWVIARILRDRGDYDRADEANRWFVRTYSQRSNDDKDIKNPEELLIVGEAGTVNARWHGLSDQFRFILNEIYPDILKIDPDFWRAEFEAGMMLLDKYNRPEAIDAFDKALKINPRAVEPLVGKAMVALQNYEIPDAETFIEQALKVNPNHPQALQVHAEIQFMAGELEEARKSLKKAFAVNPRDEATIGRLAACEYMLKNQPAFDALEKSANEFTKKPNRFYRYLGEALEGRRLYSQAEQFLRKAVELNDRTGAAGANLGMLYLRVGKEKEAQDLLSTAFKLDRFNVRVANSLKVLRHLEQYETVETDHYILKYDAKTDPLLALFVSDYLEELYVDYCEQFQYKPQDKFIFELFNNHEMFSGRTVALPDLHTIGACTGRVVTMVSPQGRGVLKPFNWGRVVRHEVVHLFNLAQTEYQVPHWLTEGLAVRNESKTRPPSWVATLKDRHDKDTLLTLENIQTAFVKPKTPDEWQLAYYQAFLYVEYATKRYGPKVIGKFLDAYREGVDNDLAIKKATGGTKADFEKGYRDHVTARVQAIPGGAKKVAVEMPLTLAEIEKRYEDDPKDLDNAARLAEQYQRRRRAGDARKIVETVLEKEPGHPMASLVKYRLLESAGDEEAARKVLDVALAANPDDGRLLVQLSRIRFEAKDWKGAAELMERGQKVAPLATEWNKRLVEVYKELGEPAKLKATLERAVEDDADDLGSRLTLAKIYEAANEFAPAEAMAREVLFIEIGNAEGRRILLKSLDEQGKKAEREKLDKRFASAPAVEAKEEKEKE